MRINTGVDHYVAKKKRGAVLAGLSLFLVLVLQLSVRVTIVERAYRVEELRASILEQDSELRGAKMALAKVIDPEFVKMQARTRLNMGVTPPQRIRKIEL